MNNVADKSVSAEDEVVVRCNGLTCAMGYCISIDGQNPIVLMFEPGKVTTTKRLYADYLVKCDKQRFVVEEMPVAPVEAKQPDQQAESEKQAEPVKKSGFFSKK